MPRGIRYLFYALIFAFALAGLVLGQQIILGICLALSIIIGVIADGFDNKRDEPFKKYNVKHKHHKLTNAS
ncbi:MAG: hypothetical protein OWR52_05285 [Acidibacillus sp.]|nr:hypothetical protein [Acidibacillus sp.]